MPLIFLVLLVLAGLFLTAPIPDETDTVAYKGEAAAKRYIDEANKAYEGKLRYRLISCADSDKQSKGVVNCEVALHKDKQVTSRKLRCGYTSAFSTCEEYYYEVQSPYDSNGN